MHIQQASPEVDFQAIGPQGRRQVLHTLNQLQQVGGARCSRRTRSGWSICCGFVVAHKIRRRGFREVMSCVGPRYRIFDIRSGCPTPVHVMPQVDGLDSICNGWADLRPVRLQGQGLPGLVACLGTMCLMLDICSGCPPWWPGQVGGTGLPRVHGCGQWPPNAPPCQPPANGHGLAEQRRATLPDDQHLQWALCCWPCRVGAMGLPTRHGHPQPPNHARPSQPAGHGQGLDEQMRDTLLGGQHLQWAPFLLSLSGLGYRPATDP